jgi:hypothetical protein
LPYIGQLAAEQEVRGSRLGQRPGTVTEIFKHRLQDPLSAPMETAEKDLDPIAFFAPERRGNVGLVVMRGSLQLFFFKTSGCVGSECMSFDELRTSG